jgi:hypothetical protein
MEDVMTYSRRTGTTGEIECPDDLLSDLGHALSLFQVHPSWFDDYWLKQRPARPSHLLERMIRSAVTLYRRAQVAAYLAGHIRRPTSRAVSLLRPLVPRASVPIHRR